MSQELWSAVDCYIGGLLAPHDALLSDALEASAAAGLPAIQVSPTQGKLLHVLARMVGARNILEIGTLGGYSTIWMARALPAGGRVLTLESSPKHAEVAARKPQRPAKIFRHRGLVGVDKDQVKRVAALRGDFRQGFECRSEAQRDRGA